MTGLGLTVHSGNALPWLRAVGTLAGGSVVPSLEAADLGLCRRGIAERGAHRIQVPRDPGAPPLRPRRLRWALFEKSCLIENPNRLCLSIKVDFDGLTWAVDLSLIGRVRDLERFGLACVTYIQQPRNRSTNRHGAPYWIDNHLRPCSRLH